MNVKKGNVIGVIVIACLIFAAYGVSRQEKSKGRATLADRILSMGSDKSGDSSENIEALKRSIAMYEKQIERHMEDVSKTATYWKLLAVRLQDRGLHGEALEALERAIHYAPEDPLIHYYTGVSAGIMAKSFHLFPGRDNTDRNRYFNLAEDALLRAIELDSRYLRPRYSLGVLYVFDLDRPEDAVPHLKRYLEISRNDVDTMFVLARAFFMLKDYKAAVELYDRIIVLTTSEQKRIDAQNNRQIAMGHLYG